MRKNRTRLKDMISSNHTRQIKFDKKKELFF